MHVMAGRTRNAVLVHDALRKVVALHAILVRRAIGEIEEGRLAQRAVLKFPVILQF